MAPLLGALRTLGARVDPGVTTLPFTVQGPIEGGRVRVDSSESSQFTSALLLVLPTLSADSALTLTGRVVSEPYIQATQAVQHALGIVSRRRGRTFRIPGGQSVRGRRFDVPGDASSAAYLWAAAALCGGPVTVKGIDPRWPQADLAVLDLLRSSGALVHRTGSSVTVRAGRRRPFSIDLTASPDLYPLAAVLAAAAPGRSVLRGASHVALKESDRRAETVRLLRALGAPVRATSAGLVVDGGHPFRALDLRDLADHRLLMAAAVAARAASASSHLGPAEAVRKSYPSFWHDLDHLTGGVGR